MAAIPKKFDGIVLVRRGANGAREVRIISSLRSYLVADLDSSERAIVSEALSISNAAPRCVAVFDNGMIGCLNLSCLGMCIVDFLVPGDVAGTVKRVRHDASSVDLNAAPAPSAVLCACV